MSALTARGLHKRFGAVTALAGLDLEVAPGQVLALLGASGCGKTTALRGIAGLCALDEGLVALGGRDVTTLAPERRGVGVVFQDYALFPHPTVGQNVGFGLTRLAAPDRRARISEVLALTGLEDMQARYPHELSGGQQQRVAVARAVAPRPGLLLLDEPFSSLDAELRSRLRTHLASLIRSLGCTTVLVTHDREDVFAFADQVAVVHAGRALQTGAPDTLYANPRHPAVARGLGPANVLPVAPSSAGPSHPKLGVIPSRGGSGPLAVVRPEHVVLDAEGVEGRVEEARLFGARALVTLAFGDTRVLAELPERPTSARVKVRIERATLVDPDPG